MNTTKNRTTQSIYPALRYRNAKSAITWLESALGFERCDVHTADDGSIQHAELVLGGDTIMLGTVKPDGFGQSPLDVNGVTITLYVALDSAEDVDKLYTRAKGAGAEIIREPVDTDYGSHEFGVRDPEGHVWSFGTYRP